MQTSRCAFLHNSSNPSKNYFLYAVDKSEVLTAVPSKKYGNSVKMSNIFKNVPESRDSCKNLYCHSCYIVLCCFGSTISDCLWFELCFFRFFTHLVLHVFNYKASSIFVQVYYVCYVGIPR